MISGVAEITVIAAIVFFSQISVVVKLVKPTNYSSMHQPVLLEKCVFKQIGFIMPVQVYLDFDVTYFH